MNNKAYVTAIKVIGKLIVRAGLHRDASFGGGWEDTEKSLIAQAVDEYKFYNRGTFGDEPAIPSGNQRKSTRAA